MFEMRMAFFSFWGFATSQMQCFGHKYLIQIQLYVAFTWPLSCYSVTSLLFWRVLALLGNRKTRPEKETKRYRTGNEKCSTTTTNRNSLVLFGFFFYHRKNNQQKSAKRTQKLSAIFWCEKFCAASLTSSNNSRDFLTRPVWLAQISSSAWLSRLAPNATNPKVACRCRFLSRTWQKPKNITIRTSTSRTEVHWNLRYLEDIQNRKSFE